MASFIRLGNYVVYDAGRLYEQAVAKGWRTDHWAHKANSVTIPRGKTPGHAYLLLKTEDADQLVLSPNTPRSITIVDRPPTGTGTLSLNRQVSYGQFYFYSARRLYGPTVGSLSMVELVDLRHLLAMSSVYKSYNVRCPAPPTLTDGAGAMYDQESTNGGTPWTWQGMLTSLWSYLPSIAGTVPTIPAGLIPTYNQPENFAFFGWSAWEAVNYVMDILGGVLIPSLTLSGSVFTIESYKDALTAQIYRTSLTNESLGRTVGSYAAHTAAWRVPQYINVLFRRCYQYYGTDQETDTTGNLRNLPFYSVAVTSTAIDATLSPIAGTSMVIEDDMPCVVDMDGNPLYAAALSTRANEVAASFIGRTTLHKVSRLQINTVSSVMRLPSMIVEAVSVQDLGEAPGLITEISDRPEECFGIADDQQNPYGFKSHTKVGGISFSFRENYGVGSRSGNSQGGGLPHGTNQSSYPDKLQIVTIAYDSGDNELGDSIAANSAGLFDGYVTHVNPAADFTTNSAPYVTNEPCWIAVLNVADGSNKGTNAFLPAGDRYLARINGTKSFGSDTRPLYVIHKGISSSRMITVMSTTADSGNCLWAGQISTLPDGVVPSGFCTDPFDIGAECWLLVLNSDLGSYNTVKTRLVIGEQYLGYYVGKHPTDGKSIYATRIEDNRIWKSTATNAINSGNIGVVSVPIAGGINVNATNWGTADIAVSDKIIIFQDLVNYAYYCFKTGGGDSLRWIEGTIYSAFTKDTATFKVNVTRDFSNTVAAGVVIDVQNFEDPNNSPKPYLFEGETGACCTVLWDKTSSVYRVVWVECPGGPVEVSPGENGIPPTDLFAAGGMSPNDIESSYNYF